MQELDQRDRELLAALQGDIPLMSTPFAALGQVIDMSEKEVIKRSERLRRNGVLRQIVASFDAKSLGYRTCLVAAKVMEDAVERAASIINLHPGVTQNYLRNHEFNLWFTIAVGPESRLGLEKTVTTLGDDSGCDVVRMLPALRVFKSGSGDSSESDNSERPSLTAEEIEVVRMLQKEIPLQPRPFDALAKIYGIESDAILETARRMQKRQQLRRIAAITTGRKQSFSASGMGVWAVPAERVEEVGQLLASHKAVTQCFLRPTYPDWAYNLFTTLHGRSVDECETTVNELAHEAGVSDARVLFPVKEYKRGKLAFFSPELAAWETQRLAQTRAAVS